ncbi:MAG TPA: hypothetical protein VGP47_11040 [Parachlamydiaceae bacterium]|nr:hypothetical protein [Parachlamydiaceae bacterium]
MSFNRNLIVIGSTAATGVIGYGIYQEGKRYQQNYIQNKDPNRFQSIYDTANEIKDKYTSKNHLKTFKDLSSKDSIDNDRFKKEVDKVATTAFVGYLHGALQENQSGGIPVFEYQNNLPLALPSIPDEPYKGFFYSGSLDDLYNLQSHQDIVTGNYLRCPNTNVINHFNSHNEEDNDVVVTGTTDHNKCNQLVKNILWDYAMIASGSSPGHKINPEDILSDTPVIDASENGWKVVSDLTSIPDRVKKKIRFGNFTTCDKYTHSNTRLSPRSYKKVGAIVVGTTDQRACTELSVDAMIKELQFTEGQNNQ